MNPFSRNKHRRLLTSLAALVLLTASAGSARAITITGSVNQKFIVTGMAVASQTPAVLKLSFENNTSGTNLSLCAGTIADFNAGKCAMLLSSSGGPGFQFLTIVDTPQLNGKVIYVLRAVGNVTSKFTLVVE